MSLDLGPLLGLVLSLEGVASQVWAPAFCAFYILGDSWLFNGQAPPAAFETEAQGTLGRVSLQVPGARIFRKPGTEACNANHE